MSRNSAVNAAIEKTAGRDAAGRFTPGHKHARGRKAGGRNRISAEFIADVYDAWEKVGVAMLREAAFRDPVGFVELVALMMPAKLPEPIAEDMDPDRFAELVHHANALIEQRREVGIRPSLSASPARSKSPSI